MVEGRYKPRPKRIGMSGNLKLLNLNLQNFATFQDQTVEFGNGFNAIVGETGSGKSLILDALQLILGQRADRKIIRKGCEFACVEAVFKTEDPEIKNYFLEMGHPFEDEIVIKRIILKSGSSKAFLNYQQCPINLLATAGRRFIDLVGQFENQKLFSEKYQLSLLDNFSANRTLLDAYHTEWESLKDIEENLEALKQRERETSQRLDYINFQLDELNNLDPDTKDEEELKSKKESFLEMEDNKKLLDEVNFYFDGGEGFPGLQTVMTRIEKALSKSKSLNSEVLDKFRTSWEELKEINFLLNKDLDLDLSEKELEQILTRLDLYKKAQRKFGVDTEGLVKIKSQFESEKETLENIGVNLASLEAKYDTVKKQSIKLAQKLHDSRTEASERLSKLLTEAVRELRMNGASFDINISKGELGPNGFSKIELNAETNPGEGFFKVKDIASGGELSRILLALRQVLSSRDSVSIFLFDEIDTGMGGETAFHIGKSLDRVAEHSQVIAITHLPQIASFADRMLEVTKEVTSIKGESRTVSTVNAVEGKLIKEKVSEMTPLSE